MNIAEAVRSQKRFKRPYMNDFIDGLHASNSGLYVTYTDFIADDWEIEEKAIPLTRSKLFDKIRELWGEPIMDQFNKLCTSLGLDEK